jgi:heme/copper-type cytochrome/quinol oxidase subunit 2
LLIQYAFEVFYLSLFALIISFTFIFYIFSRKSTVRDPDSKRERHEPDTKHGMHGNERNWLYFLLAVVLLGNLVTLSPLIPSANYGIWKQSTPVMTVTIQVENYHFIMPQDPLTIPVGKTIEFVVISHDVTYGFGIFRKDGTMVFQMQVVPEPYKNSMLWVFDQAGFYDLRSTEYSGPRNPTMFVPDAIQVVG